jgi:hypothetical protein
MGRCAAELTAAPPRDLIHPTDLPTVISTADLYWARTVFNEVRQATAVHAMREAWNNFFVDTGEHRAKHVLQSQQSALELTIGLHWPFLPERWQRPVLQNFEVTRVGDVLISS